MKKIAMGSEAVIYKDGDTIVKERIAKKYRIKEIDRKLRTRRTRSEFHILERLYNAGVKVPKPIKLEEEKNRISMQFIDGERLSENFSLEDASKAGEVIAEIHNLGVIHGDLTTANIIKNRIGLYIIDFGLSYSSFKDEDMASDLFLFKNALKSKHNKLYEKAYRRFIAAYKRRIGKEFKGINTHLKDIEDRRRYNESY